ncbi:MAG: integration host factor subunit alpha [Candidatus Sumerlaeia bacterium]|nr:integration host factor subunit alpha [Candidatus Sumerlaeia bacterium]
MTKSEVANLLMEKTGLGRQESIEAVQVFIECMTKALEEGDKVSLVGFGTFYIKEKNARKGRNPRTGADIQIEHKRVVTFKPGKHFRDHVEDAFKNRELRNDV